MGCCDGKSQVMENAQLTDMTIDEKFELACRLVERYDALLSSLESRTATVISADALLLAGTTFLIDRVLSQAYQYPIPMQVFIGACISLTLVMLALSIVYATSAIANIWKTTHQIIGDDLPQPSLFFHSSDTTKTLKGFSLFQESFTSSSKEQMLTYALSELWLITNLNVRRYKSFQWAVRLLLFSVVPFLIAYVALAINDL